MTDFQESIQKCTVISCPNFENNSTKFYQFPEDRLIAKTWKEKCGVSAYHPTKLAKVCCEHFTANDFNGDDLKPEAIPRENLGWMFGQPEVKVITEVNLDSVKDAVDLQESLQSKRDKLQKEKTAYLQKIHLYDKKLSNVNKEIYRIKALMLDMTLHGNAKNDDLISKVFSPAQVNMLMGKKKVVWSYDDMAMAFSLRHVGNKECYLYLKDTLNFPLPSLSAVQRWVASNKLKH